MARLYSAPEIAPSVPEVLARMAEASESFWAAHGIYEPRQCPCCEERNAEPGRGACHICLAEAARDDADTWARWNNR